MQHRSDSRAKKELEAHMQHIGEAMAKATSGSAGAPGGQQPHPTAESASFGGASDQQAAPKQGDKSDIIDADVEIIDDDKK